ncbi:MAG: hypothetical protein LBE08_08650 [Bifidobacteriaceae bacterium]|nr:hypothetical protein [Bifidobacteriaceae bacterium]
MGETVVEGVKYRSGKPKPLGVLAAHPRRLVWALALLAALGMALGAGPGAGGSKAQAAQVVTYYVNTTEAGTKDATPGDGLCRTANKTCSLRAAIEESNATQDANTEVIIEVEPGFAGTIHMPDDNKLLMTKERATGVDTGAYFYVTRTVTINLDGRLSVVPDSNDGPCAFWIEAQNVKLRNFNNVYSGETAIVFGPGSAGSSLDGGALIQTNDWRGERLAFIRPGANNVSISNFKVSRLYDAADRFGAIVIRKSTQDSENVVSGLRFSNLIIDNAPAAANPDCSSSDGSGCSSSGIVVSKMQVKGLVIEGSEFRNFPLHSRDPRRAIDLAKAEECSAIDIRNNIFTNILTGSSARDDATVLLPEGKLLTGNNYVRGNTFDNSGAAAGSQAVAVGWQGGDSSSDSTEASHLYIEDNDFNGYARASVALVDTGAVTVRRNTFGTATASAAVTENEETWGGWDKDRTVMVLNEKKTANRRILTWYPVAASVTPDCEFQVELAKPAASKDYGLPYEPVTIDFYYTVKQTAEVYLGSVSDVTAGANGRRIVTVPDFPPADIGNIRVQTQGAPASAASQIESSQYSRTLALPSFGTCRDPKMTLELRAWHSADPGAATDQNSIHDSVVDTGTQIAAGGSLASGQEIWFTYTVRNAGRVPLADVHVTDDLNQEVCVIELIPKGGSAGCAKPYSVP